MTSRRSAAPSKMNSRQTFESSPALDQVVDQRLHDNSMPVAPSTRPSGCLWPSASIARAATSTRSFSTCRPSIWLTTRSSLDRSDASQPAPSDYRAISPSASILEGIEMLTVGELITYIQTDARRVQMPRRANADEISPEPKIAASDPSSPMAGPQPYHITPSAQMADHAVTHRDRRE
jgi:hypothetical protein